MPSHRDAVRSYYDRNTSFFLAFNRALFSARKADNIHRSLWTNGARTLDEALNVINEYILKEIESVAPMQARVADLGCGVGASLIYIHPRLQAPARTLGL